MNESVSLLPTLMYALWNPNVFWHKFPLYDKDIVNFSASHKYCSKHVLNPCYLRKFTDNKCTFSSKSPLYFISIFKQT